MKLPPWRTPTPRPSRRKPPSPGRLLLYGTLVTLLILSLILIYEGWLAL